MYSNSKAKALRVSVFVHCEEFKQFTKLTVVRLCGVATLSYWIALYL